MGMSGYKHYKVDLADMHVSRQSQARICHADTLLDE